jgi:hypothetical protein
MRNIEENINIEENTRVGEELLRSVLNAPLTSVQFVLNYLILGFDAKGALTTLVWPTVTVGSGQLEFGDPGYRDSLCELITVNVQEVTVSRKETITIVFANGTEIAIDLATYTFPGERAIFTTPKHQLFTW